MVEEDEKAADALQAAMLAFIGELDGLARRRVNQKNCIEQRWIEDLLQYHGRYDQTTQARLDEAKTKSKVYINKTRRKTNAIAAKLYDMLFPTDDRNWGVEPSPVPELRIGHERAQAAAETAEAQVAEAQAAPAPEGSPEAAQGQDEAPPQEAQQAPVSPEMQAMQQRAQELRAKADELQSVMETARLQADMMQAEIDDKFTACSYQAKCRDAIDWMCKIGTGIMKGPVTGLKMQTRWQRGMMTDEAGNPQVDENGLPVRQGPFEVQQGADDQPAFCVVDPWSYFPDMDSGPNVADGEGDLERHLMNKKALRALAERPGFNQDAIRRIIKGAPRDVLPNYISELRTISGETALLQGDCYQVWEYSGAITAEQLRDAALYLGDADLLMDAEEADPLVEIRVVIWFSQGELLYVGPYPLDSCETLYSVFCFEKDELLPFGYGVPYLARDPQRVANAAWRMMMDNAPLSAMPQIVYNPDIVEPADGTYNMVGGKVWKLKQNLQANQRAFDLFDIPTRQADLAGIIELASKFIDDEVGFSQLAEGQQGNEITKTSSGMAMLMNSTDVMMRRVVRNIDDDMTVPNVRRIYHWLMQHSPKEEIKGDYEVDARGSSVLLVRELQQQNLIVIANSFGAHPIYKNRLKPNDLMRMIVKSMLIPADELVPTDAEISALDQADAEAAAQATQAPAGPAGPNPELEQAKLDVEREKIETMREIANMKADLEERLGQMKFELGMQQLAEKVNISDDGARAKLANSDAERTHKERLFAGEAAMTARQQDASAAQAEADRAAKQTPAEPPRTGGGYL